MGITSASVKTRLDAAGWTGKDDEARAIITGATSAELKALDAAAVLRLYEALYRLPPRIFSSDDRAALKRLAAETQFQKMTTPDAAVDQIKAARPGHADIQIELTPGLVTRIYAAEKKRLSFLEKAGFDGDTVGRGQLGQPAYTDVCTPVHFKAELERFLSHLYLSRMVNLEFDQPAGTHRFDMSAYKVRVPGNYSDLWPDSPAEDFVVAAYLAIRIQGATKSGRSSKDAARFAVALYHGMRTMVVASQTAVKDDVTWAPVEADLKAKGHTDEVDYVNEVVK